VLEEVELRDGSDIAYHTMLSGIVKTIALRS